MVVLVLDSHCERRGGCIDLGGRNAPVVSSATTRVVVGWVGRGVAGGWTLEVTA